MRTAFANCLIGWSLTVGGIDASGRPAYDAVVAPGGSGTGGDLQAAIDRMPADGTNTYAIFLQAGVYPGQIMVAKGKNHLRLVGENPTNTVVTYALNVHEAPPGETYQFNPGTVVVADDFQAENLTFENTAGDHGQALALRVDGDRARFRNCRLTGWQDTLLMDYGRDYFTNCYVAGRVDFIYGSATAVFDHCEIHSRNGGHVTAASTPAKQRFGFVFLNCRLTGDSQPWVNAAGVATNVSRLPRADLGRPWRPTASVAYLNCWMDQHIKPEGWNNWRNPQNERTARYAEYQSTGPGANPAARVKWAHGLTEAEAKAYTVENILGGADHWNPTAE